MHDKQIICIRIYIQLLLVHKDNIYICMYVVKIYKKNRVLHCIIMFLNV